MDLPLNQFVDITDNEYHQLENISAHKLMHFIEGTGAAFRIDQERRKLEGPTQAMQFGSAAHIRNLTPEKYASCIIVAPSIKTKGGGDSKSPRLTSAWKEFESAHKDSGKILLTPDEADTIEQMNAVWNQHPFGANLNKDAVAIEKAYFTQLEILDIYLDLGQVAKLKPDRVFEGYVNDYKTCQSLALDDLNRSVEKYNYDFQAAFYLHALNRPFATGQFKIDFQMSKPPYDIRRVVLTEAYLNCGWSSVMDAIAGYANSYAKNFEDMVPALECYLSPKPWRIKQEYDEQFTP